MSIATNVVQLPSKPAQQRVTDVRVDGDALVIEQLTLHDPTLAAFVAERPADDRPTLIERALRIGLTALQDAGVSVNVDVVRREFESLLAQTQLVNERAARTLEETLRQNFADGDGRLPRTLERFLGDRAPCRAMSTSSSTRPSATAPSAACRSCSAATSMATRHASRPCSIRRA